MKLDRNDNAFLYSLYTFISLCGVVLVYMFIQHFDTVVTITRKVTGISMPFIYAFSIAYVLTPLVNFLERRPLLFIRNIKKLTDKQCFIIQRTLSIFISYIFLFLLFGFFIYSVVPQIVTNLYSFISLLPDHVTRLQDWGLNFLSDYLMRFQIDEAQIEKILNPFYNFMSVRSDNLSIAVNYLYDFVLNLSKWIKNFGLALIISIYMIVSKEFFAAQGKKLIFALLSKEKAKSVLAFFRLSDEIFSGFIIGKIIDSIIIGILCFIGTSILNIPYAILISVLVGITNVIPYFGPFIGAIPSILLLVFINPLKALIFAVFIFALQQFDGNYLGPKILGKSLGLPAFWVIFAIIIGGGILGILGMFIGVPTFAVIYTVFKQFAEKRLKAKNMPTKTSDYQ